MPKDKEKDGVKPSPLGNFFSKISHRMRSRSPATPTGKENLDDDGFKCPRTPDSSSSRFGTLVSRFSTRKPKKIECRDASLERDASADNGRPSGGSPRRTVTFASSPRPAMSENDLRHVTLSRGGADIPVTPLAAASQFMSEDNLASVDCGTPAHRVPSYLRVSCALNGYSNKSPRSATGSDSSPVKAMGMSLVERRLQRYQPRRDGDANESPCSSSLTSSPNPPVPSFSSDCLPMGANYSTPSPVKSLIGQFDRLNLCSTEKDAECSGGKENEKPQKKTMVVDQPIFPPNQVHPMKGDFPAAAHVTSTTEDKENEVIEEKKAEIPTLVSSSDDVIDHHGEPLPCTSSSPVMMENGHSMGNGDVAAAVTSTTTSDEKKQTENQDDVTIQKEEEECDSAYGSARSGPGFRRKLEETRTSLQKQCEKAESELEEHQSILSDGASSSLRMASGKARLLIRKKLGKFEELVNKNMNPIAGDPQPALLDDLEGYWALVEIELDDIQQCFLEVDRLRQNDWQEVSNGKEGGEDERDGGRTPRTAPLNNNVEKTSTTTPKLPRVAPKRKEEDTEKAKSLAAARRAQLAELKARKRQEMQQRQQNEGEEKAPEGLMVI